MMELMESRGNSASVPSRRQVHRSRAVLMMARLEADLADNLCLVCDISPLGARLKTTQDIAVGDRVLLDFGDMLEVAGTARWSDGGTCGIEFAHPVDLAPLFDRAGAARNGRYAVREPMPPRARRSQPRLRRCAHLALQHAGSSVAADLFDISPAGARIVVGDPGQFTVGSRVGFSVEDRFDCEGTVRWIGRSAIGVAFDPPLRLWKLEKWLLDGIAQCQDCQVADCSAPAFRGALAKRELALQVGTGSHEPGRKGER